MSLFIAKHHHNADHCPARDAKMGGMLLGHLAPNNAKKFGVTILADAVADGRHDFYIIAQAAQRSDVERFMQPFAQAGPVEILPASRCEEVVERGGCDPASS